jgi:hypothetical protein
MVRDRRLGGIHRRHAVHEGGRAKRGLPRKAGINEHGVAGAQPMRIGARQFHEEIMRVLAIHQRIDSVSGLARRQEKRIAVGPHERIGREHETQIQHAVRADIAPGRGHSHARQKRFLIAARPIGPCIHAVEHQMAHHRPIAGLVVEPPMACDVGLPGCA